MVVFTHTNPSTGKIIHVGLSKNPTKALNDANKPEHWKHIAKYIGIKQDILLTTDNKDEAKNLVTLIAKLEKERNPSANITVQL